MDIDTSLEISKGLVYRNNPLLIIILDSKNTATTISNMDQVHRSMGMKMFGYHYFIAKDGTIYRGRPENAFSCNIENVLVRTYSNLISGGDSPLLQSDQSESTDASKIQSADRIFICLEGNTDNQPIPPAQRSSLVALAIDVRSRNRNIRNVYSLAEIYPQFNNLGKYVDFNSIRADIMKSTKPVYIDTPAGTVSYTFGKRKFIYNPDNPMVGNDIKLLQLYYKLLGIPVVNTDGVYDAFMRNTTYMFQKSQNLPLTGDFGPEEFDKIIYMVNSLNQNIAKNPYRRILYYRPYSLMEGNDVKYLEDKLVDLRYLTGKNGGVFTETISNAIKRFQQDKGLTVDGKVGPLLWDLIDREIPVFFSRILKYTEPLMTGSDVLLVQKIIKQNVKKFGIVDYSLSGKFDLQTSKNIKKIQSMSNFSITGEVTESFFNYLTNL